MVGLLSSAASVADDFTANSNGTFLWEGIELTKRSVELTPDRVDPHPPMEYG